MIASRMGSSAQVTQVSYRCFSRADVRAPSWEIAVDIDADERAGGG